MKISCSKEDLLKSVNISLRAIPSKSTLSIMQCIFINCDDKITFTSNDGEMAIETVVDGKIYDKGHVAVEAKIFSEIIRKLPDSEVSVEADENYVVFIKCEKARFKISGMEGNDFAGVPSIVKDRYISISQFSLKEIIRQTIFSISENQNNPMMGGELFEVENGNLRVASLDGHRISIRNIELKDYYEKSKVIIPGKTLNEISKILTGGMEDEVLIYFSRNNILFEMEGTIIVSRLIEGEYFKIDRMISADYETKIVINKKEFCECIERSTLLIKESDKKPIILNIKDGEAEIKMMSSLGTLNEEIEIIKTGKDICIGFNPFYLLEALRVIDEESVTIYMVNPKAPCFIRDEKDSYIYLILPVNFNIN